MHGSYDMMILGIGKQYIFTVTDNRTKHISGSLKF